MAELSFLQAINAAIREEMARDERVFMMGEDITFNFVGTTAGLLDEFGPDRVRNTPISEAGFVGAGAGAAMVGMRPIVDMMISPFLYCAFDQVASIVAKSTYIYGGQAKLPITLRAAMFYGGGMAAQHSDRPLSTFMTIPGLKIIAPSNPYDAKGLLKSAIREDDPVMCFEDLKAWGTVGEVPDEEYLVPLGEARIAREGTDVTVVAIAGMVPLALQAAEQLAADGTSVEVLDPRTLMPLDTAAILRSVEKTRHLVIVDPSTRVCSVASEIAAVVAEEGFWHLEAPIVRLTAPHTHTPFSPVLEALMFPDADRIAGAVQKALS